MKKIFILLFLVFFGCLAGCSMNEQDEKTKKRQLSVAYYDGDVLIMQDVCFEGEFKIADYKKDGFELEGWFLDSNFTTPYSEAKLDEYFEMKQITLYAKMNRVMRTNNIMIQGILDNLVVLNPAFTWDNNNGDSEFTFKIFKGEEVLMSADTTNNYFVVSQMLERNTEYKLSLTGKSSEFTEEIPFKTMDVAYDDSTSFQLANPFSDNMVLQRNKEIEFVGNGPKNSLVSVSINNQKYFGVANNDGLFKVRVPAQKASFDPIDIVISNEFSTNLTISNVLVGDVFLFAGQSNMQWPTQSADYQQTDVINAKETGVRFFAQDVVTSPTKLEKVKNGRWFAINDTNYQQFSAIAFMSGSILSTAMNGDVPIGIVTAYQGDTNIANWMGSEYYNGTCSTKFLHYNAMIYPLRHTKLAGVVWYQGCNNSAAGGDYKDYLLALFENYRALFKSANLPFFVIGLVCYDGDNGNNYDFSYVRESQALACEEDSNAYFVSACDDGDPTYIHPRTKRYICVRVSKLIQAVLYGRDYLKGGPTYLSHTIEGNKVIVQFKNAEGLNAKGEIKNLYVAGADGKYYAAQGQIVGQTLVASSPSVPNPIYIKYGFGKSPFVNIFNKDNFAITPFRTDRLNANIDLLEYNDLSLYKYHPDGSKMEVSITNGNLAVHKLSDGIGYGSVRLEKWGMINYDAQGFKFALVGQNTNCTIAFRAIEGSSEIWSYKVIDNFVGEKEFFVSLSDFEAVYNKQDGFFDMQKIQYIEIMFETYRDITYEITEARFVDIDKTAPKNFSISSCSEEETLIKINIYKAVFADNYNLIISKSGTDLSNPVYTDSSNIPSFSISKDLFTIGTPYYVFVSATNELGSTAATNNGFVFYLKDANKVIICNFDFTSQESLDAYIESSMSVHAGLQTVLQENGVKIISSGAGWQQFIFKLETGLGQGMSKLQFTADFSNYKGELYLQLADTNWNTYQYILDFKDNQSDTYTIDFSQFMKGDTPFTTQTLMWVMFNFQDGTGNGYILLDDVQLLK